MNSCDNVEPFTSGSRGKTKMIRANDRSLADGKESNGNPRVEFVGLRNLYYNVWV